MQAQGGAAIAQGLASAGQGIGSGIEKYQQNKIILAGQIGDIEAGIERLSGINPNFISSVPPEIQKNLSKLQKDGTLGVKEAAFTNAYLSTAIKSAADEQERTRAEQAARISGLYRQGDGRMPSMVNERSFDPVALEQGRGAYLRDALTQGQLRKLEAETQALGVPKTPTQTEFDKRLNTRIQEFEQRNNRPPSISEIRRMQDEVVRMPNEQPDPYGVIAATKSFENDDKLVTTAQGAYERELPRLYQTLDLLNSGNVNTGIFSELKTEIDRLKSSFLEDKKAGKKVSDSQVFDALTGSRVFSLFQQLGVGARGLDTPAERVFMIEVLTGRRTFELDALKELTRLAIKDNENLVKNYARKFEIGALDRYFTGTSNPEPLIAIRPKEVSPDDWAFMTQEERDVFAIKKK
jgi:hypothetical protein